MCGVRISLTRITFFLFKPQSILTVSLYNTIQKADFFFSLFFKEDTHEVFSQPRKLCVSGRVKHPPYDPIDGHKKQQNFQVQGNAHNLAKFQQPLRLNVLQATPVIMPRLPPRSTLFQKSRATNKGPLVR